nr:immunoglobulin heavy chain junction region [Macaca mulatta]MOX60105.1 immunoglobulin heavy chain junction region [Macaca mulatta]MOX60242.1 immunoglobulin heavy chain junction region [Macaca mulatta]MOX60525.1 immunoglobulin heavy chain junction region [Macaca mulatta]MOX60582.1 immunoglobulin heavy chain junction region [Macaca mulatta]
CARERCTSSVCAGFLDSW